MWYLNTLANSLKLVLEITTKFRQKVKNSKHSGQLFSSPRNTIKFPANGLTIYLATYIPRHMTCGGPIYPAEGPNKNISLILHHGE
jgi:hypothetical protein